MLSIPCPLLPAPGQLAGASCWGRTVQLYRKSPESPCQLPPAEVLPQGSSGSQCHWDPASKHTGFRLSPLSVCACVHMCAFILGHIRAPPPCTHLPRLCVGRGLLLPWRPCACSPPALCPPGPCISYVPLCLLAGPAFCLGPSSSPGRSRALPQATELGPFTGPLRGGGRELGCRGQLWGQRPGPSLGHDMVMCPWGAALRDGPNPTLSIL